MPNSVLFIVADGARARFVARSSKSADFVTLKEVDGSERLDTLRAELRASPPGRSFESMSPTRRSVGADGAVRLAKEAFVREIAAMAADEFSDQARGGVVLVTPARLMSAMRSGLNGRLKVIATLQKDLTKTPDHDLRDWLAPLIRPTMT